MQTINRNNYEEFFLLYMDNELDAQEKLVVENFIQHNPDLVGELEMLVNTKFPAEEIVFADKENLLRTEGNSINETNYEEYFLLYIDDELSIAKRGEVEMYVLQHPKLQDEFTTLKQTVLTPEAVSYGDKKDLFRTQERRVIYLKPLRLAAAAIFIGVCAVGFWLMQKPDIKLPVANNNPAQNKPGQNITVTKPVDSIKQELQPQQQVAVQTVPKSENKPPVETAVATKKKESIDLNRDKGLNNEERQVVIQQPVITHNKIVEQQKEPPVESYDIVVIDENLSEEETSAMQKQIDVAALQISSGNAATQSNYNFYPVAYKEININDDDRSLHVGGLDLNKDKVKTLFKKAGRLFGNKSNNLANEDGKLQVANFEIDTKKL